MNRIFRTDYSCRLLSVVSISFALASQCAWSETIEKTGTTSVVKTSSQTSAASEPVPGSPAMVTTTTVTTSTSPLTPTGPALRLQPIEQTVQRSIELKDADLQPERIRKDNKLANRLAKSHWLEKAVAEDPEIIAAITQYRSAAKLLARHPRLGYIAEYDHYLCRQLTRWKSASRVLARNPQAQAVLYYDPEGIYRAIKVDKSTAQYLAHNTQFAQMVLDNPELAKVLASYM